MGDGNVICGGNVGDSGVDRCLNVASHLCLRMGLSYGDISIRACVRLLVSIIFITVCLLKIVVISSVFCFKSSHFVI